MRVLCILPKSEVMVVVSFSREVSENKFFVSGIIFNDRLTNLHFLARARTHIKHHFFLRARPTRARKSQTLLSSIDLSIDDRGWKGGSSFLHRLLFLLEMHKSSVFFVSMKSENGR